MTQPLFLFPFTLKFHTCCAASCRGQCSCQAPAPALCGEAEPFVLSLEPPLPHLDKQLVLCLVLAKFHLLSNLPPSSKSPGTSGAACSTQASLVQTPVGHLCSSTNHSVPTAPRLLKSDVQKQYPSYPLCPTKLKRKFKNHLPLPAEG